MTHLEDSKIIALFYERSEQAIAELDRKYGAAVRKTAANILNNRQDVDECANDTYLGVWNTIPPQNPNPLTCYYYDIRPNERAFKRNSKYAKALDDVSKLAIN